MSEIDPPVPVEADLRGFSGFMLDVDRLLASELVALGTPEECWAAVMLWCRAWKQSPPGSLPTDDRVLAAFSGARARWPEVKAMALRGFVLCSDGRLYHPVLAEQVSAAWNKRKAYRSDQDRLKKWRDAKKSQPTGNTLFPVNETPTDAVSPAVSSGVSKPDRQGQGQGQGQGQRQKEESKSSTPNSKTESDSTAQKRAVPDRGSRLPDDWNPGEAGRLTATKLGLNPGKVFEVFRDYWIAVPGAKGRKLDWLATWNNWCRREAEDGRSRQGGQDPNDIRPRTAL